jgi:hypothetical protein
MLLHVAALGFASNELRLAQNAAASGKPLRELQDGPANTDCATMIWMNKKITRKRLIDDINV